MSIYIYNGINLFILYKTIRLSSETHTKDCIFKYAWTGHKGESGIETNGMTKVLSPNWMVLDHYINTLRFSSNIKFFLQRCCLESNVATVSGTKLDFLNIRKKACKINNQQLHQ